jgi:hypothetical protein
MYADKPPTKAELEKIYNAHLAKRNRELEKLHVEVEAMRAAAFLKEDIKSAASSRPTVKQAEQSMALAAKVKADAEEAALAASRGTTVEFMREMDAANVKHRADPRHSDAVALVKRFDISEPKFIYSLSFVLFG